MAGIWDLLMQAMGPREAEAKVVGQDQQSATTMDALARLLPQPGDAPEIVEAKRRMAAVYRYAQTMQPTVDVRTVGQVDPADPATRGLYTAVPTPAIRLEQEPTASGAASDPLSQPHLLSHELLHFIQSQGQPKPYPVMPQIDPEGFVRSFIGNFPGDNPTTIGMLRSPYDPKSLADMLRLEQVYRHIYPGYR